MKRTVLWMSVGFFPLFVHAGTLGERVYQSACITCHAPEKAKALKAPAAFDRKAWEPRIQNAERAMEKHPDRYPSSMDYLTHSVEYGKGLMHHGGLCKESQQKPENCSKEAYKAAIEYMTQEQPKNVGS